MIVLYDYGENRENCNRSGKRSKVTLKSFRYKLVFARDEFKTGLAADQGNRTQNKKKKKMANTTTVVFYDINEELDSVNSRCRRTDLSAFCRIKNKRYAPTVVVTPVPCSSDV